MITDIHLPDKFIMRLHFFYLSHKNDPLATKHLCGMDIQKRIIELESEMHNRIPLRHLWNIEVLQRDNNITPTL